MVLRQKVTSNFATAQSKVLHIVPSNTSTNSKTYAKRNRNVQAKQVVPLVSTSTLSTPSVPAETSSLPSFTTIPRKPIVTQGPQGLQPTPTPKPTSPENSAVISRYAVKRILPAASSKIAPPVKKIQISKPSPPTLVAPSETYHLEDIISDSQLSQTSNNGTIKVMIPSSQVKPGSFSSPLFFTATPPLLQSELFKVPIAPVKMPPLVISYSQQQKILQAYRETMANTINSPVNSDEKVSLDGKSNSNSSNWIYRTMANYTSDVKKFKVRVCQLLDIPNQESVAVNAGSWLEALILRSCWFSQKRMHTSEGKLYLMSDFVKLLNFFHLSTEQAFTSIHRRPLYFDPNCNHQIALCPSGDTLTNSSLIDRMIDFMHVLARLQLDEVELSLVTAWLLFDDSEACQDVLLFKNENVTSEKCKAGQVINLKKTVHQLLYEYHTKVKPKMASFATGSTSSYTFRTMNVLLTLAELAGIAFLMGM